MGNKVNKTISLSYEMEEQLQKEENASRLIDELLKNHYSESPDFKRIRIMNKIKLLKNQKKEIEIEEKRLSSEVELFMASVGDPKKEIKEVKGRAYGKTFTHQGAIEKDKLREDLGEAQ